MAPKSGVTIEDMNSEARARLVAALEGKGAHLTFEHAIHDFPERLMNEKPPHVPYTFWHQLEHIRRTQADMLDFIQNPNYVHPAWPKDFWPGQDERTNRAGWDKTVKGYLDDRSRFIKLIEDPKTNLLEYVERRDGSIFESALIITDHNAYHLGEFVMARQILGEWKSELA
jgi:hypothetical protein